MITACRGAPVLVKASAVTGPTLGIDHQTVAGHIILGLVAQLGELFTQFPSLAD